MKITKKAFTLIEIMIGILIFSIVIIGGFQALSSIGLGKIKLIEKTNIIKESFYFSEKLFEEIKSGGTIDYEEYFNRKVLGTNTLSGVYLQNSGFGNFGSGGVVGSNNFGESLYYCASGSGSSMGTGGCFVSGNKQRYLEYRYQFIDFNSNMNADGGLLGDEDGDGNIKGDDDDENLGEGPIVFTGGTNVKELYLISGDRKKRTYFRWRWIEDPSPNKPAGATCSDGQNMGSGCLGTIEFLKLEGKDWGINHNKSGTGYLDGVVDTWIIDKDFTSGAEIVAGSLGDTGFWQSLFPKTINVADFQIFIYPNIDKNYAWKSNNSENINPYIKLIIGLSPSWKKRGEMKGKLPNITLKTTINLSDYFSK